MTTPKHFAVVGAGIAAITCARTLAQAGHHVTVLEKSYGLGGRMSTRSSPFGTFDHGAQYFTVRDPRFEQALATAPGICRPWSANTVQVLDSYGRVAAVGLPQREYHWVPSPGMRSLVEAWALPLVEAGCVHLASEVTALEPDALHKQQWQLRTTSADGGMHVFSGFDGVVLAIPCAQAQALLTKTPQVRQLLAETAQVTVAPCWTLMLAYPQAVQPGLTTLGPQWNAARSTHHRVAWLARESSKPGRSKVERWTVQASAAWSQEHLHDTPARVQAKLIKAFAEITGIHAQPSHAEIHRWLYAKTEKPLGKSHLLDVNSGVGLCGDWCLGHRVEDAFVSGLELALHLASL